MSVCTAPVTGRHKDASTKSKCPACGPKAAPRAPLGAVPILPASASDLPKPPGSGGALCGPLMPGIVGSVYDFKVEDGVSYTRGVQPPDRHSENYMAGRSTIASVAEGLFVVTKTHVYASEIEPDHEDESPCWSLLGDTVSWLCTDPENPTDAPLGEWHRDIEWDDDYIFDLLHEANAAAYNTADDQFGEMASMGTEDGFMVGGNDQRSHILGAVSRRRRMREHGIHPDNTDVLAWLSDRGANFDSDDIGVSDQEVELALTIYRNP